MSINYDNEFGMITFYCDGNNCDKEFVHDDGSGRCDPKQAAAEARREGWQIDFNKAAIEWTHFCPECKRVQ